MNPFCIHEWVLTDTTNNLKHFSCTKCGKLHIEAKSNKGAE